MAVFSKKVCQQKLNTWMAAEEAIATGQAYQIGSRSLTRADLKQVREEWSIGRASWQKPKPRKRRAAGTGYTALYPVMCRRAYGKTEYHR